MTVKGLVAGAGAAWARACEAALTCEVFLVVTLEITEAFEILVAVDVNAEESLGWSGVVRCLAFGWCGALVGAQVGALRRLKSGNEKNRAIMGSTPAVILLLAELV